jgi:hypothetical protein
MTYGLALLGDRSVMVVILDGKTKTSRVNVPVSPDKESTEDWLGQEVEDAVEDGLRIWRNDVAALGNTPCNGVQDPQECSQGSAHEECTLDIATEVPGVRARLPDQLVDDVDESKVAESEVSPLVLGGDECANKTGDNHDLIDDDGPQDARPWHSSGEHEVGQEQRGGDDPVDVANIVDRTVVSTNHWVVALELYFDGSETEVGAHGEVGNGGNEDDSSCEVVENAVATLLAHTQTDENEARDGHGRANGKVQV